MIKHFIWLFQIYREYRWALKKHEMKHCPYPLKILRLFKTFSFFEKMMKKVKDSKTLCSMDGRWYSIERSLFYYPFHVTGLFLHSLKTSGSHRFSDVFRGYRKLLEV